MQQWYSRSLHSMLMNTCLHQVPILIDHGATIIESALVVEYLDKAYPDTGTKLYPDDPAAAFKVCLCHILVQQPLSWVPALVASTAVMAVFVAAPATLRRWSICDAANQ